MTDLVEASAPGKVVLWGEYAVLAGAPAAVLAVDRRAICRITPDAEGFLLSAEGFSMPSVRIHDLDPAQLPRSASLFAHAASALRTRPNAGLAIHLDTTDFHTNGRKLGIGSSAAALVACYGALCAWYGEPFELDRAIDAHRRFQGSGSGLDVAAAFLGGTTRFQAGTAWHFGLPPSLRFCFLYTGRSASTGEKLGSFSAWREQADSRALEDLVDASTALFEDPESSPRWSIYVDALRRLDDAAGLGIFSAEHKALGAIAQAHGLLYKPCGAGGGDVGMAIAPGGSTAALQAFGETASSRGYQLLNLSGTPHGLQIVG